MSANPKFSKGSARFKWTRLKGISPWAPIEAFGLGSKWGIFEIFEFFEIFEISEISEISKILSNAKFEKF